MLETGTIFEFRIQKLKLYKFSVEIYFQILVLY